MEKSRQKGAKAFGFLFFIVPPAEAGFCQMFCGSGIREIVFSVLFTMFFCGTAIFYLGRFKGWLERRPYYRQVIFICTGVGLPFAFFYGAYKLPPIFYLGAVLIAALVELSAGFLFCAGFWAIAALNCEESNLEAVTLLMLGIVLCLLAGFLKEKRYIFRILVLGSIVTAILYFLRTGSFDREALLTLGRELFATAAIQGSAALFIHLYLTILRRKRSYL